MLDMDLASGGTERSLINVCRGLLDAGLQVSLAFRRQACAFFDLMPETVRLVPLGLYGKSSQRLLRQLHHCIAHEAIDIVWCWKHSSAVLALRARKRGKRNVPVILFFGTHFSQQLRELPAYKRSITRWRYLRIYRQLDYMIANAPGIVEDLMRQHGIARHKISPVPNMIIDAKLFTQAAAPIDCAWLQSKTQPVFVAVGRLVKVKNFSLLIAAFAQLRAKRAARLILIGDGPLEPVLRAQAQQLGVSDAVLFTGFLPNPYPFIAAADALVLSSTREGSPNVIVEALALKVPVVATDCATGPRELLADGRYGWIANNNDVDGLKRAMERALTEGKKAVPQAYLQAFTLQYGIHRYIDILGQVLARKD